MEVKAQTGATNSEPIEKFQILFLHSLGEVFCTLSAFILARVLVFLANRDKKYIYPKGIFRTGKFTF